MYNMKIIHIFSAYKNRTSIINDKNVNDNLKTQFYRIP